MSGEIVSSDVIPPACQYFRDTVADSDHTDHDRSLALEHTKMCRACEDVIGQMIHEKIESNAQAETSGT